MAVAECCKSFVVVVGFVHPFADLAQIGQERDGIVVGARLFASDELFNAIPCRVLPAGEIVEIGGAGFSRFALFAGLFLGSAFGFLAFALRRAGFANISEEFVTVPLPWPGPPAEAWQAYRELRGRPFAELLEKIPTAAREQADAEIVQAIAARYDGRQVNFTAEMLLASATRP